MALSYKARRGWSLVILLIGMPLYVIAAVTLVTWLDRPSIWLELAVYVVLGFLWMLPFKFVFKGIGQADPDAKKADGETPSA
jgi:predicted membrane channel-forming protein YqfA (hemolysin III family)